MNNWETLVSHVPPGLKAKMKKICAAKGTTASKEIREMIESFCDDGGLRDTSRP